VLGYNYSGQIGDNTTINKATPVDVSGLTAGVSTIALGGYHSCILTTSGGIKCWDTTTMVGSVITQV